MDSRRISEILSDIKFRDWNWEVAEFGRVDAIRLRFEAPDSQSGQPMTQWGRWWVVDYDDSDTNVVKTALLAVLTATEHEVREDFYYKGKRVHSPHRKV